MNAPSLIPPLEVRNIWAVGRNYAEHAKELGNQVPELLSDPMIFLKSGATIVPNATTFQLPTHGAFGKSEIHFECELALQFSGGEFKFMSLALDLTAREIQTQLKKQGHPWTLAKSFIGACPLGPLVKIPTGFDLQNAMFQFSINGDVRQTAHTRDMIHSIKKLKRYVLENFPVQDGDLLLTGTPAGVGALNPGDRLDARLDTLIEANWQVEG